MVTKQTLKHYLGFKLKCLGRWNFLTLNNVPLFTYSGRLQRAQAHQQLGMSMKKKKTLFVSNGFDTLSDFWEV